MALLLAAISRIIPDGAAKLITGTSAVTATLDATFSAPSASTTTTSPQIKFLVDILTTCEPANIRWTSSDKDDNLFFSLAVTDFNTNAVLVSMDDAVDVSLNAYHWSKVNVSQGRYYINALFDAERIRDVKEAFLVENGTDTSCIQGNENMQGESSEPPVPSHTSSFTFPVPTETVTNQTSSESHFNRSEILGASLGPLLLIGAIIALFYLYRRRSIAKKLEKSSQNRDASQPIIPYPTGLIKSTDYRHPKNRDERNNNINNPSPSPISNDMAEAEGTSQRQHQEPQPSATPGAAEVGMGVRRHEDSGWRPPLSPSRSARGVVDMPPEYENAL
ncbi:hypothetical protein VNI00_015105 [Paramarasmius palmivorus]|uniref:Uncharacterized protein n=1 Tax=Paramarasmius palmivorus TaxID=297713 RepID=A0AAW0BMY7_9AGAR